MKEGILEVACHTEQLRLGTFYLDLEKTLDDAIKATSLVCLAYTSRRFA